MRTPIPLAERKWDYLFVGFFWLNLLLVTYIVDLEQLVIADPNNFSYPRWPPRFMVDAIHWWSRTYDHDQMAREMWWKMTIWIDVLLFGPFYVAAIYAFTKGKDWIRVPSIIYASVLLTNVTIILGEEFFGAHPTPGPLPMIVANAPWVLVPLYLIARMWSAEHPFTRAT